MQTTHVGIREAKMHLSRYLKMVRKGSEVIITDRGKPVGKIVPIEPKELPLLDRVKRLEDRGLIERRSEKPPGKIPPAIPLSGNMAQKFLQEDRNHG
jgi:prevent-host-death family protein